MSQRVILNLGRGVLVSGDATATPLDLASPVKGYNQKDIDLVYTKGTLKWLARLIWIKKTGIRNLRLHNFNESDGSKRSYEDVFKLLNEFDVETFGNITKLLSLQKTDTPFEPCLINLKAIDLHDSMGMDWETSTYVVYAWIFSGTYKNFKDYDDYINKNNIDVSASLKTKIRTFLDTNSKYEGEETILYLNYIGETTKTGAFRGSKSPGQHGSDEGGGSKGLSGLLKTSGRYLKCQHSLLYVALQNTNNLDGIDFILQDRIKFVEALFATLCGRGTINIMNCGWFYLGRAWYWRLYDYVQKYSHKDVSGHRVWTKVRCIDVIIDDESLMSVIYSKGCDAGVTIEDAWKRNLNDMRQAAMAAYNLAGEKYGMDMLAIALLLGKHKDVKGNSVMDRLTSIVGQVYGNDMEAVMEAVHEIRSKNKGNYDKSIALAKEGTGLSHGAVRFILGRLHPNVLRGGNPVDRLVFILEEMYGNDLDKVIADMKKNGRSETGRHINGTLSSPTNNKTSGSSSSSTTSTTSTNNRTSSSDEKGSGGSSQRNTIYTNQDNSVESQLWDRYFLAESEGDVQKSAAVLSQWSARYIDICRHSRRENLPAATLIESSSTGSGIGKGEDYKISL